MSEWECGRHTVIKSELDGICTIVSMSERKIIEIEWRECVRQCVMNEIFNIF